MTREVVVVGAGPAGLAAAEKALLAGASVTLVDSSDQPGGQYHRMLPEAYAARNPQVLHHGWGAFSRRRGFVLQHPRCRWWERTSVWALENLDDGPPVVHVLRGGVDGEGRTRHGLEPDALVLAPGAFDRVLPFPGWDLPGVYTAGAAQALAKGERIVVGDRVVVAGTGPFLLPVAASLLESGSHVVEVLEANRPSTVARGWSGRPWELLPQSGKALELLEYAVGQLRHHTPYRMGRAVVEARGDGRVEEVVTARLRSDWSPVPGTERTIAVDAVCVGHGFTPQLELFVSAGCAVRGGFVAVDDDQRTSAAGVFAAGEVTGIAGAPAAQAEGAVAGWVAAGGDPAAIRGERRRRDQGRAFARRLARAHPIGAAWPDWLQSNTVVCRCEETSYGDLCRAMAQPAESGARAVRLGTRAGLGPCQARVCGSSVADIAARQGGEPVSAQARPIAQPIRLGELAGEQEEETR